MKKKLLQIMILSAISCSIISPHAYCSEIPLSWYSFNVEVGDKKDVDISNQQKEDEEKHNQFQKDKSSKNFKNRINSILKKEKSKNENDSKNHEKEDTVKSLEDRINEIKLRREKEDKILKDLMQQQKSEKEKKIKIAKEQEEKKKKDAALLYQDYKHQQIKQNEQIGTLLEKISKQQEQIQKQQEQLNDLQKYKKTMVINPAQAENDISNAVIYRPKSDALTLTYMEGSNYQIYCRPNFETDIQLKHNEEIVNVYIGDSTRWFIKNIKGNISEHILIKPSKLGLETNLIITTNQRIYQLNVKSAYEFNPIVNWTYPLESMDEKTFNKDAVPLEVESVNSLDFGYLISKKFRWRPDFVFNDGFRTYIHMPEGQIKKAPAIFVKNNDNTLTLINYTVKNGNYVIDQVIEDAQLRIDDQIVNIRRN